MKPIDMHVHVVGNGSSGSGCWIRPKGLHKLFARFMLSSIGLPQSALTGDLDRLCVEKVLEFLDGSSLGAIVILAQDQVYDEQGRLMEGVGTFYVPNDHVLGLVRQHPGRILPAVSIHPARPDAMEELERCLAAGAVAMKCLPNCHNIDCNDRRYTKFWERMAEAKLPLLAHTGGEHVLEIVRPEFANPKILELPLQCGVACIAAHCGSKGGLIDPDYFDVLVAMIKQYPNLYGDISAFNIPTRSKHFRECLAEPLASRMLHGSDFPVPVNGHWVWARGLVDWQTFRRWERHPNILERDYQLKRAMGFPDETFTRAYQVLRVSQ